MDTWIGDTKQHLIMSWGPPARTASDGGTGQILIYAFPFWSSSWKYKMFYVDSTDKIYHWFMKTEYVPPAQLNVDMYIH